MHFASNLFNVFFHLFELQILETEEIDVEALLDSQEKMEKKIEKSSCTTPNCITSKGIITWYGCALNFFFKRCAFPY
jgi:hypothetical protein